MNMPNYFLIALASVFVSALAALTGCGGSGEGLDSNGNPINSQSGGTELTADFNSIQNNVFTPICTTCHIGAGAPHGLRLDASNSYALLVGVASDESPSVQRVKPGDPNASYIIQKLEGTAAIGERMPFGGPYLPQSTINVIRQWIANGAQKSISAAINDKSALAMSMGLRVLTTSPLHDSITDTPISQVVIVFNQDLDVTLINSSNVVLERIDSNDLVTTAPMTLAATLTVPAANPQTLLITPQMSLGSGSYRLRLRGTGGGVLAGINTEGLVVGDSQQPSDVVLNFAINAGEPQ
jgi:hypothetical protein